MFYECGFTISEVSSLEFKKSNMFSCKVVWFMSVPRSFEKFGTGEKTVTVTKSVKKYCLEDLGTWTTPIVTTSV